MSWLALSPLEVVLLSFAATAVALWLYLHQRPVRRRVSTLRFWTDLPSSSYRRRRSLREPWAFLAQVLFLVFLIMALANPRWGREIASRRVVLVLDTSIWSQLQPAGEAPWIDQVRQDASQILNELPASDDVLLLRADVDATPIVPFTQDRLAQRRAIAQIRASSTVADVPSALEMGRAALAGARRGLLVYIGSGMVDDQQSRRTDEFRQSLEPNSGTGDHPQFLLRLVGGRTPVENRGIARLALERDPMQPDHWHVLAQLKNYGQTPAKSGFQLKMNGQIVGQHTVSLVPYGFADLHDELTSEQGGLLQAQISPADALKADDHAVVYVPPFHQIRVVVFTARPGFTRALRPVLSTDPYLRAEFSRPGVVPAVAPDIAIYDGAILPAQPAVNSIYFVRGQHASVSGQIRLTNWNPQHPVTRWVRTRDVSVRNPALLDVRRTDVVLASSDGHPPKPLIVAREQNGHKILLIGFDPQDSNFPQQAAFPLLVAGAVEWLTHPVEDVASVLSAGELDLPGPVVRIVGPSGQDVPFARNGSGAHLLALDTGAYRVVGPNGATTFEVNAPALLPFQRLNPTSLETAPVAPEVIPNKGRDLWQWLVALAMIALWTEWWLFYRERLNRMQIAGPSASIGVGELRMNGGDSSPSVPGTEVHAPKFTI
ncbi:MAG TPA: BatA domain-containing protein [Candidatus Acidoferrales bacterium]|nr:BatA domain-containing protein [Candidatus Acidoferrales bacterium]